MKMHWNGVEWNNESYFYWWNWLPRKYRYLGFNVYRFDGSHFHFGFWFFNWSWRSTFWTKYIDKYVLER